MSRFEVCLNDNTARRPDSGLKITNLSQGTFVGAVSDNFGEEIEQKIFHAQIVVDNAAVAAETKAYRPIPVINQFRDADGNDIMIMQQQIQRNYDKIKADIMDIVEEELQRIKADPKLKHLFGGMCESEGSELQEEKAK